MSRDFLIKNCDNYPSTLQPLLVGWHCSISSGGVQYPILSILSVQPILNLLIFNEPKYLVVITMMLVSNISFFLMCCYYSEIAGIWMIAAWTCVSGIVVQETHLFRVGNFLTVKKLQETIEENKRMQEENRATELRHMIGNLAHDLKTVSSCIFMLLCCYSHSLVVCLFVVMHSHCLPSPLAWK